MLIVKRQKKPKDDGLNPIPRLLSTTLDNEISLDCFLGPVCWRAVIGVTPGCASSYDLLTFYPSGKAKVQVVWTPRGVP